jgi:hypothetical protein
MKNYKWLPAEVVLEYSWIQANQSFEYIQSSRSAQSMQSI